MPETITLYKNYITTDEYDKMVKKYELYKPVLKIIQMCKEVLGVENFVDLFEIDSIRIEDKRRSNYNTIGIGGRFADNKNHGLKPLAGNDIGYYYESKCITDLSYEYSREFGALLQQAGYKIKDLGSTYNKYYTEYYRPSKSVPHISDIFKITIRDSKKLLNEINYYKKNDIIIKVISDNAINNRYKDTDDVLKEVEEYLQNKEN